MLDLGVGGSVPPDERETDNLLRGDISTGAHVHHIAENHHKHQETGVFEEVQLSVHDEAKPRVLVIDDDPANAETLAMVLNISGFQATAAHSGEQALEFARENAFDHLVTDVMMSGMNGIEAALAIRQMLPNCRVLLISGNNRTTEVLAAATTQGHEFEILAKPVHPLALLERMRAQSLPPHPQASPLSDVNGTAPYLRIKHH